ncbi:hypothetical protein KI811_16765 [Geobacter hydrogenophilus]|uniref:Uncharacterized protein n=1 Tax=Geobacter hydrogenophilus TaxID=40983 RepID=A0A9W6G0R4_9BACT|nr:hypothetical protein [Geobacter hydrogenophilus]MBT0895459.1 hypothetical protein [Geobacter hydrogenophilus]GLI38317.1 hypothetical protein GHYDROH2_18180 [Geobacter hydrogenophilus]
MKFIWLVGLPIIFLLILAKPCEASRKADGNLLKCKGPGCEAVAVEIPWPEAPSTDESITILFRGLSFRVPSDVASVGIGDNLSVFRFKNGEPLLLGCETFSALKLPKRGLSVIEAANVLFTKTPKDPEPSGKDNRKSWRLMLSMKRGLFQTNPRLAVYRKGPVTIYQITKGPGPYRNVALVSHAHSRNFLMRLESNCETNKFVEILSTISVKEK